MNVPERHLDRLVPQLLLHYSQVVRPCELAAQRVPDGVHRDVTVSVVDSGLVHDVPQPTGEWSRGERIPLPSEPEDIAALVLREMFSLFDPLLQQSRRAVVDRRAPVLVVLRRVLLRDLDRLVREFDPAHFESFSHARSQPNIERDHNQGGIQPVGVGFLPVLLRYLFLRFAEALCQHRFDAVALVGGIRVIPLDGLVLEDRVPDLFTLFQSEWVGNRTARFAAEHRGRRPLLAVALVPPEAEVREQRAHLLSFRAFGVGLARILDDRAVSELLDELVSLFGRDSRSVAVELRPQHREDARDTVQVVRCGTLVEAVSVFDVLALLSHPGVVRTHEFAERDLLAGVELVEDVVGDVLLEVDLVCGVVVAFVDVEDETDVAQVYARTPETSIRSLPRPGNRVIARMGKPSRSVCPISNRPAASGWGSTRMRLPSVTNFIVGRNGPKMARCRRERSAPSGIQTLVLAVRDQVEQTKKLCDKY